MSYIRKKTINGNDYYYEQSSERIGNKVITKHIKYIGKYNVENNVVPKTETQNNNVVPKTENGNDYYYEQSSERIGNKVITKTEKYNILKNSNSIMLKKVKNKYISDEKYKVVYLHKNKTFDNKDKKELIIFTEKLEKDKIPYSVYSI